MGPNDTSRSRPDVQRMVTSPCINVCTVDDGVCTACNRTLEDIATWAAMTEAERIERMRQLDVSVDSS